MTSSRLRSIDRAVRRARSARSGIAALATVVVATLGAAATAAPQSTGTANAPAEAAADEFPAEWFWRMPSAARAHVEMTGKKAPELNLDRWIGETGHLGAGEGKANPLPDLAGKVVVVDFWATWCGPCMRALPDNVELVERFGRDDLVIIGVHDPQRGHEKMAAVMESKGLNYPLAIDAGGSVKAWNVRFWPTIAVVDRAGVVRAVGLQPNHLEKVVEKLVAEPAPAKKAASEADPAVLAALKPMIENSPKRNVDHLQGTMAPEIDVSQWMNTNGESHTLESLRGKIVVLDFWATWCGPCMAAVPKTNALMEKYQDRGVVVIGVCMPRGGEKMAEKVADKGMKYPVCLDPAGRTVKAYQVNGYPDYAIIDREGRLVVPDCRNNMVEKALDVLLAADG